MNHQEQKKHGYKYKREDLYTAIVFCKMDTGGGTFKLHTLKYRNIAADKESTLGIFKKFLQRQYPTAQYMNLYGGMSGDFYKRVYLN